jgi:transketolase
MRLGRAGSPVSQAARRFQRRVMRRAARWRRRNLRGLQAKLVAHSPQDCDAQGVRDGARCHQQATDLTIGGSADLTHSNLTVTKGLGSVQPRNFEGRYVHFGVREHAMAAAMNGIALHGGFIPYGGTFFCFCRLRPRRHAPVGAHGSARHLCDDARLDRVGRGRADASAGRASGHAARDAEPQCVPSRRCCRDGRVLATRAGRRARRPPSLPLSRQNLPTLRRTTVTADNLCAKGAYVLRDPGEAPRHAPGDGLRGRDCHVGARCLAKDGISAAVVSMPCWELFESQSDAYRAPFSGRRRASRRGGGRLGWDRWIGERGRFIGMTGFGASARVRRSTPISASPLRPSRTAAREIASK